VAIDAWGVSDAYLDQQGIRHELSPETRHAILAAMGVEGNTLPAVPPVHVIRAGQQIPIEEATELRLEDGSLRCINRLLPADLPLGYHQLGYTDRPATRLIVTPPSCYLPKALRIWGWAAQLYAARSTQSWGIGDFADLGRLLRWSAELGAGMVLINPLQAATPVIPQEASPYLPSSRRYRNVLYLRIENVPGAIRAGLDLNQLASAGWALNGRRQIDRDQVFQLKMRALEQLWQQFRPNTAFERYCKEQGVPLVQFATFCALSERHGRDWRCWPAGYRHPDSPAVAEFAATESQRVRFYEWVQWLLDVQLREASAALPVMHDLPVGFDAGGADAWAWQDLLANDAAIGAPPDEYSAAGQDWGLPPFVPQKLQIAGYEPFAETVRALLRHAGGLRIDHVMALFRLFWIPSGMKPADGVYVHYSAEDLLGILALESQRAKAVIVGEDLGTVAEGVREQLSAHGILSYRVLWFESDPPQRYPKLALAAATNHDLPTITGLWSGADLREQEALQLRPARDRLREMRERIRVLANLAESASDMEAIESTYRILGKSPCAIIMATLDDAAGVSERPNLPGTTTERANWSLALPRSLENLEREPLPQKIATALRR
jgi:4-alpha-glucanotransferase